jgi:hypothetical protein
VGIEPIARVCGDAKIRKLKPKATPYKVSDRDGLYLLVQPNG